MRRGCVIFVLGSLVLCLLACGAGYFIGLPRLQDGLSDEISDVISTQVAEQIPAVNGSAQPGEYTFNEAVLQDAFARNVDTESVDDFLIRITPENLEFVIGIEGGEDIAYSGVPVAINGQLEMTNMETNEGFFDRIYPADKLGDAIEEAVNDYLDANGLQVSDVQLVDGEMTIVTTAAT
jgi:hypothetical protein